CSLFFLFFSIIFITCFYFTTFIEKSPAKAELFRQAEGTLHIRKCPLRHFKEFVMMVGCDEFVVNRINYGGNYNEIII
ncbi:hypothetical protein, partial [Anaeromassilibacillus sp. An172]|uniref:hypothetical protein n=1 Tax=Anaeromassilibacillus sp. An172 TaxID=1965570 RepID=UPI00194FF00E